MIIRLLSGIRHNRENLPKGKTFEVSKEEGLRLISLKVAECMDDDCYAHYPVNMERVNAFPTDVGNDNELDFSTMDKETACVLSNCDLALLAELRAKTNKQLRDEISGMGLDWTNKDNKAKLIAIIIEAKQQLEKEEYPDDLLERAKTMSVEELARELSVFGVSTEESDTQQQLYAKLKGVVNG